MSKPLGLSASFEIIRPSPFEDAMWDAVEAAIDGGLTPEEVIQEMRRSWREYLKQKVHDDDKAWERGISK